MTASLPFFRLGMYASIMKDSPEIATAAQPPDFTIAFSDGGQ
ncbi:hypothetical protein [Cohnella sp. REN36]|nr:hypothetical protein [Cohnella sp. REN36]